MTIITDNNVHINESHVDLITLLATSPKENLSFKRQIQNKTKCKDTKEITPKKNKMGVSKDTSDIKETASNTPLKSCILIPKGEEKVSVKKAKSVHFADSLGKPLKSVKTLHEQEDYLDLTFLSLRSTTRRTFPVDIFRKTYDNNNYNNYNSFKGGSNNKKDQNKLENFKQPVKSKEFQSRVENENVCLENVVFREYGIFATITVKNISYQKDVSVRFTTDKWESFKVIQANYVPGSTTGVTDTFSFEIIPGDAEENQVEIQFAICFAANGHTYWDSNYGKNYIVLFKVQKETKDLLDKSDCNGFILPCQNFIGWST